MPDEDVAPLDQQEELDDVERAEKWFHGATLWSTDWTTETLLSQLTRGNINLNPRFQRRNAWRDKRKSLFIESLILGLPIPQIILAEDRSKRGSFIVIDGKQRLLTLRQFAATADQDEFNQLRLTDLKEREDLNGIVYQDLKTDLARNDDLGAFENQTIRTVVIRNWEREEYLYSVFLRINTGSVQLSTQELRQALHPGPFSDFVDDFSVNSPAIRELLGLAAPDFRMRDAELALRFFAYKNFANTYTGNLKKFLDDTTEALNNQWPAMREKLEEQSRALESALAATKHIFSERTYIANQTSGRLYWLQLALRRLVSYTHPFSHTFLTSATFAGLLLAAASTRARLPRSVPSGASGASRFRRKCCRMRSKT